jgi:hypothetical protein
VHPDHRRADLFRPDRPLVLEAAEAAVGDLVRNTDEIGDLLGAGGRESIAA